MNIHYIYINATVFLPIFLSQSQRKLFPKRPVTQMQNHVATHWHKEMNLHTGPLTLQTLSQLRWVQRMRPDHWLKTTRFQPAGDVPTELSHSVPRPSPVEIQTPWQPKGNECISNCWNGQGQKLLNGETDSVAVCGESGEIQHARHVTRGASRHMYFSMNAWLPISIFGQTRGVTTTQQSHLSWLNTHCLTTE